jgi:hypothetical protein
MRGDFLTARSDVKSLCLLGEFLSPSRAAVYGAISILPFNHLVWVPHHSRGAFILSSFHFNERKRYILHNPHHHPNGMPLLNRILP